MGYYLVKPNGTIPPSVTNEAWRWFVIDIEAGQNCFHRGPTIPAPSVSILLGGDSLKGFSQILVERSVDDSERVFVSWLCLASTAWCPRSGPHLAFDRVSGSVVGV